MFSEDHSSLSLHSGPHLGAGDAAEVQGFNHQAGARGVQLHASELV